MEVDSGRYTCRHSGYHVPVNVSVFVTVIQPGKLSLKTVFFILKNHMYILQYSMCNANADFSFFFKYFCKNINPTNLSLS